MRRRSRAAWCGISAAVGSVLTLVAPLLGVSCREHGDRPEARNATAPAATSDSASPPSGIGTLPEDAEAGARSVAEWRQHLEHEELERRLSYDRHRLGEHRAVLSSLHDARRSFDTAPSVRAVLAAERGFKSALPMLEKKLDAIDPHGVSSKVLPDYRKVVQILEDPYPAARLGALSGDAAELRRLGKELDARFEAIDAWLREAAESEDE